MAKRNRLGLGRYATKGEYLRAYKYVRRQDPTYRQQEIDRLREYARKTRLEVLTHYSDGLLQCARCLIADIRVLCLDHINEDGSADRMLRGGGYTFLRSLMRDGLPPGLQVLCYNCHAIKCGWHTKSSYAIYPKRNTR